MDYIWVVPEKGTYKINVHYVLSDEPLPNGNINGVGGLIRNDKGAKLWGVLGPVYSLTEEQAIMTVLQAACIQAIKMDWHKVHIETVNRNIYDTISLQDHAFLDDEQFEMFSMFNTLHANNYKEGSETSLSISWVPLHMNSSAEYMARYGMENLGELVETTKNVGNLDYYLKRDMGMTLPLPFVEVVQSLGDGEVIDDSPPKKAKKRKLYVTEGHWNLVTSGKAHQLALNCSQPLETTVSLDQNKGKEKIMEGYAFNENGVLSAEAVRILDEGKLAVYSEVFKRKPVDLDAVVGDGVFAKDVLHHAILGSVATVLPKLHVFKSQAGCSALDEVGNFLKVDQVLKLMGFDKEVGVVIKDVTGNV